MTWISLIGITLAVFALVATLSVRSGFRTEIVDTILGANSHITVYKAPSQDQYGNISRTFKDYDEIASNLTCFHYQVLKGVLLSLEVRLWRHLTIVTLD